MSTKSFYGLTLSVALSSSSDDETVVTEVLQAAGRAILKAARVLRSDQAPSAKTMLDDDGEMIALIEVSAETGEPLAAVSLSFIRLGDGAEELADAVRAAAESVKH